MFNPYGYQPGIHIPGTTFPIAVAVQYQEQLALGQAIQAARQYELSATDPEAEAIRRRLRIRRRHEHLLLLMP
ncbi:MAG: hypothetical protein QOG43_166 [Actinomycetota bacterium]|nr:hypothetical protein [Actinomycetota bacterium]